VGVAFGKKRGLVCRHETLNALGELLCLDSSTLL
jgi:hypothetical protein